MAPEAVVSQFGDIRLRAIDDRLAVVRGFDGERLGDWILDEQRNGPWQWIPVSADAPRDHAPADNLFAAETAVRESMQKRHGIE